MERVVLRETRDGSGTRFLEARLEDGAVVIEGQDLGPGVVEAFGASEYEWVWTIEADSVPALCKALDTADVLAALQARFSGPASSGLRAFLDETGVPYSVWSRVGD